MKPAQNTNPNPSSNQTWKQENPKSIKPQNPKIRAREREREYLMSDWMVVGFLNSERGFRGDLLDNMDEVSGI